jgi:hypothetical protein
MTEMRSSLLDTEEWIKVAERPMNTTENENHFEKGIV